jgi:uncharacterized membrane protein HdeD (DUF308 family)
MFKVLARNWWAFLLRGTLAVFFGLATIIWPDLTAEVLVLMLAVYALADGLFSLHPAIKGRGYDPRWWIVLLPGLIGTGAGALAIIWPGATASVLLYLIAVWSVLTGAVALALAMRLPRRMTGQWLLGIAGIGSVLLGLLMLASSVADVLEIVWLIATVAVVTGAMLAGFGLRLQFLLRSNRGEQYVQKPDGRETRERLSQDTRIVSRVLAALADDPRTRGMAIEVISERGVVTLRGEVEDQPTVVVAEQIARDQPDVYYLINAIQVRPGGSLADIQVHLLPPNRHV